MKNHLYKYKSLENDVDIERAIEILSGKLYFPYACQLNDPMEFYYSNSHNVKVKGFISKAEMLKKVKVLSFSKTDNSLLTWIHYTNTFKGVCFAYHEKDIQISLKQYLDENFDIKIIDVEYVSGLNPFDPVNLDPYSALGKKFFQWAYEDEKRIVFIPKDEQKIDYLEIFPTRIIFGSNCDPDIRSKLEERIIKESEERTFHPNICLDRQKKVVEDYKKVLDDIKIKGNNTKFDFSKK